MEAIIQVMESAVGARDPYTVEHQQRVTQIACAIAERMGLSGERLKDLQVAGSLHDLGKIAVPAEILSKPGKLTDLEFAIIKTHPQTAYNILKPLKFPGQIFQIIMQHHERMDGSGYPRGLRGEDILLEARILGVADVLEAMCSHRPYRPALGIERALEEISHKSGTLYDSGVVANCLALYQEAPEIFTGEGSHWNPRPRKTSKFSIETKFGSRSLVLNWQKRPEGLGLFKGHARFLVQATAASVMGFILMVVPNL